MEERLKSHYESLSRAIAFTRSADTKATPVLALQVALVGTLAARFDRLAPTLSIESWGVEAFVLVVLMVLYAVLLVVIVALSASVYLPRNPRTGCSLIYYEDISMMSLGSFRGKASAMTPELIERQLLQQIHTVSAIASKKMRRVQWAYFFSVPSVMLWVILLGWGAF